MRKAVEVSSYSEVVVAMLTFSGLHWLISAKQQLLPCFSQAAGVVGLFPGCYV